MAQAQRNTGTILVGIGLIVISLATSAQSTPPAGSTPTPSGDSSAIATPSPRPTVTPLPSRPLATPTPPPAGSGGFVTRSGQTLMLGGQPYRFTGLNIYNANSDGTDSTRGCWYAMSSGDALDRSLNAQPGAEAFRAWFFQGFAIRNGARDWGAIDHTLSVAAAHGVKVIVTLANQWPECDSSLGYKDLAWYQGGYRTRIDPNYLTTYRDWVAEIVTRYRGNPTILMWQLLNEAEAKTAGGACDEGSAASALRAFTDDVGGLIHALDPNHLVNLGTVDASRCGISGTHYRSVHASAGTDLCEYHDYDHPEAAMPGAGQRSLLTALRYCAAVGKPLFVGETGIDLSQVASVEERAAIFDAKFAAQFDAGVVGELIWNWDLETAITGHDVGPNDPVLDLLSKY